MKTLLIDGDIVLYKALTGAEQYVEVEDDLYTLFIDLREAKESVTETVSYLKGRAGAGTAILCLSDKDNFRKELYPDYKANRKKNRKPVAFKELRAWAEETFKCFSKPGLEADDCLGIMATKYPGNIIWSEDKDLKQIPGTHLIDGKLVSVLPEEADLFHLTQTLVGDQADNYPGCPGVGAVKAAKILAEDPDNPWGAVAAAFVKAGKDYDYALLMARLARILRWEDWDHQNSKPILWTPHG